MNGTIIVGKVRMVKIARFLGEEGAKKVFINSKGEQFFLPEALREDAEAGDHVLVIGKEYTAQGIDPATGQPKEDEQGNPVYDGEKFTRYDATLVGDYETVAAAFYEDEIMDAAKGDFIKEQVTAFKTARKLPARKPVVVKDNAEPSNVGG